MAAYSVGSTVGLPNFNILKELVKESITKLLTSIKGKKDLILDEGLMKPLDRIIGAQALRSNGVDKIFPLKPNVLPRGEWTLVFLLRPDLTKTKIVADIINADIINGKNREYKILMAPRSLYSCEQILEYEGVFGKVTIEHVEIDLIPIDQDILSMELPEFFTDYFLNKEQRWLQPIAQSLWNLQSLFGLIPNVYGKGRCAAMINKMVQDFFTEYGNAKQSRNQIGNLFLIDRDVDFVSPLLTQLTYLGLLDEEFEIKCGVIEFGKEITGKDQVEKMFVTSQDPVFEEVRDCHFSSVFDRVKMKVQKLQDESEKMKRMTPAEMRAFVANELKSLQQQQKSLITHISACEAIMKKRSQEMREQIDAEQNIVEGRDLRKNLTYIENLIIMKSPPKQSLRLLCLVSLSQDGLSQKEYSLLKTSFLQAYGHEHLLTFSNLEKMGLLAEQAPNLIAAPMSSFPRKSSFSNSCRRLNLIPNSDADVDVRNPVDPSFVFGGMYTPLICNLVLQVLNKGSFAGLDDIIKLPTVCENKAKSARQRGATGDSKDVNSSRVVLVYFLGGVTFAEIAAFRLIGRLNGYRFIIATTSIINGNKIMESAFEKSDI